ncbi:MAG: DUF6323 family protein [Sporolactobacillus sp.]
MQELTVWNSALIQKQAVHAILGCNARTAPFGLILTENQAIALEQQRFYALKENGRVEFGGGVIEKLIAAFCDSPYLCQDHYEETLHELLTIFYYYKNETLDLLSDSRLIAEMKQAYNGPCHGSLELLAGDELERLSRDLRSGGIRGGFLTGGKDYD